MTGTLTILFLVLMFLGLSLVWRKRWMTITGVSLALVAGLFLVLLNIPNGPLESLRDRPEFGRLGQFAPASSGPVMGNPLSGIGIGLRIELGMGAGGAVMGA